MKRFLQVTKLKGFIFNKGLENFFVFVAICSFIFAVLFVFLEEGFRAFPLLLTLRLYWFIPLVFIIFLKLGRIHLKSFLYDVIFRFLILTVFLFNVLAINDFNNFVIGSLESIFIFSFFITFTFFILWLFTYVVTWQKKLRISLINRRPVILNGLLFFLISSFVFYLCIILGNISFWFSFLAFFGLIGGYLNIHFMKLVQIEKQRRPEKYELLGINIDNKTCQEAIERIDEIIDNTKKGDPLNLVVTPYSEYFIKASKDSRFKEVLNGGILSLADGIFVLWGASFQNMPTILQNPILRAFTLVWNYVFSGACIILYPEFTRRIIKDRVSGSELIYPLMELAARRGYSVLFIGGQDWGKGNAGVLAANALMARYEGLDIVDVYPGKRKKESRQEALELINRKQPDILVVCFGGGAGETWMHDNRFKMKAKIGVGLGGTFDFIGGYAVKPHPIIGHLGLEWFVRPLSKERGGLLSNAARAYRVWRGMFLSSIMLYINRIKLSERKEK